MIAVVGIHTENFQPLADITVSKNKIPYCKKWGYEPAFSWIDGDKYDNNSGFKKLEIVLDLFRFRPDIDWAFYTDCDAMITNFDISLDSIIRRLAFNHHIALVADCTNINAGQFLIKNSAIGRGYLSHLLSFKSHYADHEWHEQQAIIERSWRFKDDLHVFPQRVMNSYFYANHGDNGPKDIFGQSGEWQPGDFIVHWPGYPFEKRLEMAEQILQKQGSVL